MADTATKLPVKNEDKAVQSSGGFLSPFDALRSEIDNLFHDFMPSAWRSQDRSLPRRTLGSGGWLVAPAVDVVEKEDAYEVTAEVPGLDEKNIDVRLANGFLTIRGEKQEEKEEERKDYHLSERRYGSFHRTFQMPEGVDGEKVEATFSQGVLKVRLPKTADAQKNVRKVEIKSA